MRNASLHGRLVFRGSSLRAIVGSKLGNVGVEIDDRVATVAVENYDACSLWTKCINPGAIRADVDIRDIHPGPDEILSGLREGVARYTGSYQRCEHSRRNGVTPMHRTSPLVFDMFACMNLHGHGKWRSI